MTYPVPTWQDFPSTATALDAANLNEESVAIRYTGLQRGDFFQRLAVPAYFYPTYFASPQPGTWERLQAAAPYAEFAVANVSSGPGASVNADYAVQLPRAQVGGLAILGYVDTNFAGVATATVESQIDSWYTWYNVDGIFFDRASAAAGDIAYYTTLYNYVKAKPAKAMVVLNQGTIPDQGYMAISDVVCNFENDVSNYATRPVASWEINYPARKFWHIIYNIATPDVLDEVLALSRKFRVGYIYPTNGNLPNPFAGLPDPYWPNLLGAVADLPAAPNPAQQLYGYSSWAFDPALVSGGAALSTAGSVRLIKVPWPVSGMVTNIVTGLSSGGTLTSGQCFAGLYDYTGAKLGASADQSAVWNSAGFYTMAISGGPVYASGAGFAYVGLLWNGSVAPQFYKAINTTNTAFNAGLSAATLRCANNSSGNTSLPTTLTLSASTAATELTWAALS